MCCVDRKASGVNYARKHTYMRHTSARQFSDTNFCLRHQPPNTARMNEWWVFFSSFFFSLYSLVCLCILKCALSTCRAASVGTQHNTHIQRQRVVRFFLWCCLTLDASTANLVILRHTHLKLGLFDEKIPKKRNKNRKNEPSKLPGMTDGI